LQTGVFPKSREVRKFLYRDRIRYLEREFEILRHLGRQPFEIFFRRESARGGRGQRAGLSEWSQAQNALGLGASEIFASMRHNARCRALGCARHVLFVQKAKARAASLPVRACYSFAILTNTVLDRKTRDGKSRKAHGFIAEDLIKLSFLLAKNAIFLVK
jgi:hypothetical protein